MPAEITQLTIKTVLVTEGFEEGISNAEEFGNALVQSVDKVISTFEQLNRTLELIGQQLQDKNNTISIFGLEFDILKDKTGTLQELSTTITEFKEVLVGSNQEAIKSFTNFLKFITDLITGLEKSNPGFVQFITTFAGISAALLLLTPIIAAVVAGVAALATMFGVPAVVIVGVILVISNLIAILLDFERSMNSVGQFTVDLWQGQIVPILEAVAATIAGVLGAIGDAALFLWESAPEAAVIAWEAIKGTVGGAIDGIKEFFGAIGTTLSGVWDGAGEKATEVWEGIKTTVSGAVESIKGFGTEIKDSITNSFSNAFDSVKEFFSNLLKELREKWDNFIDNLPGLNLLDRFFGGEDEGNAENVSFPIFQSPNDGSLRINTPFGSINLAEAEQVARSANNLTSNFTLFNNTAGQTVNVLNATNSALQGSAVQLVTLADGTAGFLPVIGQFNLATKESGETVKALGTLAKDATGIIENAFSDVIFSTLKGDFDSLKDIWKGALDGMLKSFSNFVADILAKPVRVLFERIGGKADGAEGGDSQTLTTTDKIAGGLAIGGAALSAIGAQIENDIASSIFGVLGQTASFAAAGLVLTGGNPLGAIIGAIIGLITSLVAVLSDALKKKPRLDLDFDTFRDDVGKSTGEAAKVLDFLDEELFNNEIFNRSVSRQAGLGLGGGLSETIREAIAGQILEIQDIIFRLPADLASDLNDALLNTAVDIESEVKGDRLLEFDETKDIQQKFQQFIEGDLQARFVQSIRGFFADAFTALGVLPESAQKFIDEQFEEFQGLSREQRIEFGENFINEFGAVVDAFNIINGNSPDSINGTVNALKNLSETLGFEAIPSIDQLDAKLEELISAAEFDPSVIEDMLALRAAILTLQTAILGSIQSIISNISSLNSVIIGAGGDAFDLGPFINQGLDSTIGLLGQEGLSVEDKEALLSLGTGFLDQLIAEEQAAFQAQLEAAQKAAEAAAEAQREVIRAQIDGLEEEKKLIEENFDLRLEALQEELRIAEEFARLAESIQKTLDRIILGPDSVFTAVERLNIVQGDIAGIQSELAATTDPTKQLELAGQLEDAFKSLFDLAGEAFGVNSPEFVAIFDQVTDGLNDLLDLTGNRTRSVEEINTEIEALNVERNEQLEAIDAQIESLNDRLSSIQAQNVEATFQASDRVQELAEFFRNEYITLLEERFEQLEEVSETGFVEELDALNAISEFSLASVEFEKILADNSDQMLEVDEDMLITLRNMESVLRGAPSFMNGTIGVQDFGSGTLAFLHGREAVIPESQFIPLNQLEGASGDMNVNISVNVNGGSNGTVDALATNIEDMLVRSIKQGGKLRSAVQEAGAKRLN